MCYLSIFWVVPLYFPHLHEAEGTKRMDGHVKNQLGSITRHLGGVRSTFFGAELPGPVDACMDDGNGLARLVAGCHFHLPWLPPIQIHRFSDFLENSLGQGDDRSVAGLACNDVPGDVPSTAR